MSSQARNHGNPSLGDIVRTTAVMSAFILVLSGIGWWFSTDPESKQTVDYQSAVTSARRDASFELLAPPKLPVGWYANSVRYESGPQDRWHLGVVTADDDYIGLEQSTASIRRMVEEYAAKTEAVGSVEVDGQQWKLRESDKSETSLVRRADGITTLVTGTADQETIEGYAAALTAN